MRLFVAVDLPDPVRRQIAGGMAALRRSLPAARWVRPEGIHVTLKFLGERPASDVGALDAGVAAALGALPPVTVALGGAGFFPSPERARVAWLGGRAAGLAAWAEAAEAAAEAIGVERERRPFSLHLTLARIERPWPSSAAERFLSEVGSWQFAPFEAGEAVLFESRLGTGGAAYTALRRWPARERG